MKHFIFDMDGTLYPKETSKFTSSKVFRDVKRKSRDLLVARFNLTPTKARDEVHKMVESGALLSEQIANTYGIPLKEYYRYAWDLNPADYIERNKAISRMFKKLKGKVAILTLAPRIWAERVLKHLEVYDSVKDNIFTVETNVHKPDPAIFTKVANHLGVDPSTIYSVGDEEKNDILPAKKVGMKTVIIGKCEHADHEVDKVEDVLGLVE